MQELVRLRQQQQTTDNQLQAMVQRLQGMEQRQQQMMSFLAKAVNSPGFLSQFVQQQNESTSLITEGNKKRRLKQDGVVSNDHSSVEGQIVKYQPMMNEAAKAMLRQIIKLDNNPSPHLETFNNGSDSFLINDVSSARSSGVTLQEVTPNSGQSYLPAVTGVQSISLPNMSELSQFQEMVQENNVNISSDSYMQPVSENGAFLGPNLLDEKLAFAIGNFSPDTDMGWESSLQVDVEKFLSDEHSWEEFLEQSPEGVDITEDMDSTAVNDNVAQGNEEKLLETRCPNAQMQQLTKQMGLLSSDSEKV